MTVTVSLDQLELDPENVRTVIDADSIKALAASIESRGVLQPLVVRPTGDGKYRIISGERRYRAIKICGDPEVAKQVPVVIRDEADDEALLDQIIENLQRVDIDPIDEANGYRRLIDSHSMTQRDIAKTVGRTQPHVAKRLSLLLLGEKAQKALRFGGLTMEAALEAAKQIKSYPGFEEYVESLVDSDTVTTWSIERGVQRWLAKFVDEAITARIDAGELVLVEQTNYAWPRGIGFDERVESVDQVEKLKTGTLVGKQHGDWVTLRTFDTEEATIEVVVQPDGTVKTKAVKTEVGKAEAEARREQRAKEKAKRERELERFAKIVALKPPTTITNSVADRAALDSVRQNLWDKTKQREVLGVLGIEPAEDQSPLAAIEDYLGTNAVARTRVLMAMHLVHGSSLGAEIAKFAKG